jgi:halimadienyl-diphosphate synthase
MFAEQLRRLIDESHLEVNLAAAGEARRPRKVAPAAYDTARVARMAAPEEPGAPAHPRALAWLLAHQYGDGTWGALVPYHHDRVVSTLAAMMALAQWRESHAARADFGDRIDAAAWGLVPHLRALDRDPQTTQGFVAIAGGLLAEARAFGIALPWSPTGRLAASAQAPAAPDTRRWLAAVVDDDGGVAPAGASPHSLDVFETAWALNVLALSPEPPAVAAPGGALGAAVDALAQAVAGAPADLATAALVFRVLAWAGRAPDPALLMRFERPDHFGGGADGAAPSAIAHALLLAALRASAPFPGRERAVRKAIGLLARTSTPNHHWLDAVHASPFVPTAVAVMALGAQLTLAVEAVHFMVERQRPDGSWGYFDAGTAEETAWCLLALSRFAADGGQAHVPAHVVQAGTRWLAAAPERRDGRYAPLWLGESLFCPTRMVEAPVLAALAVTR